MDAVTQVTRESATELSAAEAAERVENYLRAFRVPAARRAELVPAILEAAERRHAETPEADLTALAMDEAMALIDAWIDRFVPHEKHEGPARRLAHGRAALHLAALPQRWPGQFLAGTEPPAVLIERLRAAYLEAAPEVELGNMVPRPMDLGLMSEMADSTWRTFDKWPVLRGLLLWGLFVGLLAAAFYLVRF